MREGDVEQASTVRCSTRDGSAVAGRDYSAKSQILTFSPGKPSGELTQSYKCLALMKTFHLWKLYFCLKTVLLIIIIRCWCTFCLLFWYRSEVCRFFCGDPAQWCHWVAWIISGCPWARGPLRGGAGGPVTGHHYHPGWWSLGQLSLPCPTHGQYLSVSTSSSV